MPESADAPAESSAPDHEESALEEKARETLGLQRWDRPALFRETAEAAVDTDLPFWVVLLLSGAIATLGLLLNQTAVVIGAMLVAPLLGPLLGLSLGLASGDGRLAVHTFATLLLGMTGVIAVAALLTALLPFSEITPEIAARTRPTTLDLAIALFSGLAGAVVTVSREKRLSASIPGVAIAVALIPPLGVTGFGIGTGWNWALIKGSLLLFGANLGGIVIMGMLAFLAVGMHRDSVREAARTWHAEQKQTPFGARLSALPGVRRVGVLATPLARFALVAAFVGAVSIPLSTSLGQVLREARVTRAIDAASARLEADDEASILTREVEFGEGETRAVFRIATTAWITDDERRRVEEEATARAGEPVDLGLEQVLASRGDLDQISRRLAPTPSASTEAEAPPSLDAVRQRVADALDGLATPDSVALLGGEVGVGDGPPALTVLYAATRRLSPDAEALLARQAARAVDLPDASGRARLVRLGSRPVPSDSAAAARVVSSTAALASRYAPLRVTVAADSARASQLRRQLAAAGVPANRVSVQRDSTRTALLLSLAPDA
ncbi:MAG TPA: TIGR00341 family protein [Rhodothermales bacterium]|nr:TIGR00341 family protein [Rhodothermales bacterium]